jgi:hypothetical protein
MLTPAPSASRGLTRQELARLHELEHVIEEGLVRFLKVGAALSEIRDARLYRTTHDRFADYCLDRWSLTLSRCNQLIQSVRVYDNLVGAYPQDTALLAETTESALRPLSRLSDELQGAAGDLIKHIEERPSGTTVQEVVSTIKSAILEGWETRSIPEPVNGKNERSHHHATRQSDGLGTLCRWVNRVTTWDPEAIAQADDQLTLRRHLKAARALRTFCEAFISALETRLSS